jgi:hypothetical protein
LMAIDGDEQAVKEQEGDLGASGHGFGDRRQGRGSDGGGEVVMGAPGSAGSGRRRVRAVRRGLIEELP